MLLRSLRTLLNEPKVIPPTPAVWWDRLLVAVLVPTALLEAWLRDTMVWREPALVVTVPIIFVLLWRRTRPMAALLIAFLATTGLDLVATLVGVADWTGLYTVAFILLLPYSLVRWGSGRSILVGLGIMVVTYVSVNAFDRAHLADNIAGGLILLFPAVLGAAVRFRERAVARQLEEFRWRERELLARELHDTVAHYVSAIAVQAQAGLAITGGQSDGVTTLFTNIETASRQTLSELRTLVKTLRRDDDAELAPQPGWRDIAELADRVPTAIPIHVHREGDLDDLAPAVSTALYRLAQEAITNAVRHARHASAIEVVLSGGPERVRLTVTDDGAVSALGRATSPGAGYGLVGMAERTALLGGTFHAGWRDGDGWAVTADLPKQGETT